MTSISLIPKETEFLEVQGYNNLFYGKEILINVLNRFHLYKYFANSYVGTSHRKTSFVCLPSPMQKSEHFNSDYKNKF